MDHLKGRLLDTRQMSLLYDCVGQLIATPKLTRVLALGIALLQIVGHFFFVKVLLHAIVQLAMFVQLVGRLALRLLLLFEYLIVAVFGLVLFFLFFGIVVV